jgi:hypothetical protein
MILRGETQDFSHSKKRGFFKEGFVIFRVLYGVHPDSRETQEFISGETCVLEVMASCSFC